ncbi:jg27417 [Pararge aegeria aegeria]|uniref:Jg27417 protein n=1 Tax=Pararge aegeria aegeria TaxID=348720 RepID=A0A8S4R5C4_9NEOP|nr:jg27417 [Pararge aegeria aegeria]
MKSFIVFALIVAAAVAAPANPESDAVVVKQALDNIGVNGYGYEYETSNGIKLQETGQLTELGTENEGIVVRGQYSYVGDDGLTYSVDYTADKNGFVAVGAHIPQA